MKIAFIPPLNYVGTFGLLTNYHMALTHLVERFPWYADFYKTRSKRGDHLILDNSIIELGDAISIARILEAADKVSATEIVLPDVLDDSMLTLRRSIESHEIAKGLTGDKYKYMAVPQGKTLEEFKQSYFVLANSEWVDVIGIPKRCGRFIEESSNGRFHVLDHMYQNGIINEAKPHHMLGIYDNPLEIYYLNKFSWIRGIDSQLPFLAAHHLIQFDEYLGMLEKRGNKFIPLDHTLDLDEQYINHNIICMLRWAQSEATYGILPYNIPGDKPSHPGYDKYREVK